ncbi:MAG: CHC2 zinc finger domain-containing protein, partial [Clostridiales bacterium]
MTKMIPPEIIDEIIARTDIVEVIGEYVTLKKRGRNYFGLCPFHQEDTESFAVNADKQFFNCFGCGKGGNVISFVRDMESLSFPEAAKKLAQRAGIAIPEESLSPAAQQKLTERRQLYRIHEQAQGFYQHLLWDGQNNAGQAYLHKRGVDREVAEHFGLGYAPESEWQALFDHFSDTISPDLLELAGLISRSAKNGRYYDKFHGRLIFPIHDYQGRVIAFGGRTLTN